MHKNKMKRSPLSLLRSGLFAASAVAAVTGCLSRPIGTDEPQTTNLIVERITQTAIDKIDLLFMIDNSISMADKQAILRAAVPELVTRLVNPVCLNSDGDIMQVADADADCPDGYSREFPPLKDIHVGVVSSSMGDAGANDNCVAVASEPNSVQEVDNGYLMGSLPRGQMAQGVPVDPNAPGFLAWNGTNLMEFQNGFQAHVASTGEFGCGYEASLEAWYHFLVDPTPWQSIDVVDCQGQAMGSGNCRRPNIPMNVDAATGETVYGDPLILAQRKAFLRPDSLVAVVMLSDENDCSIIVGGPYNLVAQSQVNMFRGSSACETNPDDPCCYSCGTAPPAGCAADPICAMDSLPPEEDEANLRCYEQKRRFGLDFLYPIKRYVNALSSTTLGLCNVELDPSGCAANQNVANPLFISDTGELARDSSLVFFAGIVGVPWQLIQATTDPGGTAYPAEELHFKTNAQLAMGTEGWDRIVGPVAGRDVHMVETVASATTGRPGLPGADADADADPIHGHEYISVPTSDLQYACTFPLPEQIDCDAPDVVASGRGCDCEGAGDPGYTYNNPLCQGDNGGYSSTQLRAKAYPGLRHLEALKGFGDVTNNAIVASICARNVDDATAQDYGYNPAIGALVDRLKEKLGGTCLGRQLDVAEIDGVKRGAPLCSLVEVFVDTDGCECMGTRKTVNDKVDDIVRERHGESGACGTPGGVSCESVCLCELIPAGGTAQADGTVVVDRLDEYAECQTVETPEADGWCYVDADLPVINSDDPAVNASKNALVADCEATAKRQLRFVGDGELRRGATTYVACKGASITDKDPVVQAVP